MEQTDQITDDIIIPDRPSFLTVVCVFSFIGIGLILLMSLLGVNNAFMSDEELMRETVKQIEQMEGVNPEMAEAYSNGVPAMMEAQQHRMLNWFLGIIGNIFSLIGCIWMWKLKKNGFYLYSIAEIGGLLTMFLLGGASALSIMLTAMGMGGLANIIIGLLVFFDILFITLYALNLKHMK